MNRPPRRLVLFVAMAMAMASTTSSAGAAPPTEPAVAPAEISAGDKSAHAKDWSAALTHFETAQRATPSAHAQLGVAEALYQLGRLGEAYDVYVAAQQTFGPKLAGTDKVLVASRLKELASKTGALSIHVEDAGSEVMLDGKSIGASPMAALVRLTVGAHEVRVVRPGFVPFVGTADIQADGKAIVDATPLVAQPTSGHVIVHALGNESLRVIIDGVDLGATPWEGDLPAGPHDVSGRSSSAIASAQHISISAGERVSVDLVTAATAAHLQVRTSDGQGSVYVDGVAKGQGTFAGDVAPGTHTVVVERDGYTRFEKTVALGERETWAETVTLKSVQTVEASTRAPDRPLEGIYGGFGLAGLLGIGGQGSDLDTSCGSLGASSCDTANATGGAAFGYVGWTWDPVGFELMLAGSADTVQETAHFTTTGANSTSPLAVPPRDEQFRFVKVGGLAALRVRATLDGRIVRGTIAGGVGLSYRQLLMKRDVATTDGTNRVDAFSPTTDTGVAFLSPAITLEGAVHIRATPTVAFALGLVMWADNASIWGSNSTAAPSQPRAVGGNNQTPAPIPTPSYRIASGPQVFLGPFLGMQFGP